MDSEGILYKHVETQVPYDPISVLVVPASLRKEILIHCHDSIISGHFGFEKTYQKIKLNYFWPKMYTEIKEYLASCELCLKRKRNYGVKKAPLNPIKQGGTFERVSFDILGPFPVTDSGNKYVLLFMDSFSRWVEGRALKTITSKDVAQAFFDLIITRFGAPHTVLSDRASNFLSSL